MTGEEAYWAGLGPGDFEPIIEQVARELGASVGHAKPILEQYQDICSQTEQEKPHEQSTPKDIEEQ